MEQVAEALWSILALKTSGEIYMKVKNAGGGNGREAPNKGYINT